MSATEPSVPHLHDALAHLLSEPEQAIHWAGFARALTDCAVAEERSHAFALAMEHAPGLGLPGFFRAMLALKAGIQLDTLQATIIEMAQATSDVGLSRQCAALANLWTFAMNRCPSRTAYQRFLTGTAATTLSARIQASIAEANRAADFGRSPGRAAIVLVDAGTAGHPPTRLALTHAAWLLRAGYETHVFSGCESHFSNPEALLGLAALWGETPPPAPDLADWRAHLPLANASIPALWVTLADRSRAPGTRYQAMLAKIAGFAPDFVLLIGYTSGMMRLLYEHYPVVASSTLSAPPLAPADVWLSPAYPPAEAMAPWHPALPIGKIIPRTLRLREESPAPSGNREALRRQLGLTSRHLVILTAGGRLNNEIPQSWLARWRDFLLAHAEACWLLVGSARAIPGLKETLPAGQVRQLPWSADLQNLAAAADIYANPPRLGGGMSVLMAMAAGVPVVSFADSDGGDKVEDRAVPDDQAYFSRLHLWATDPTARAAEGAAMRRLFLARPDEAQAGREFLGACETARDLFAARQGQALPAWQTGIPCA